MSGPRYARKESCEEAFVASEPRMLAMREAEDLDIVWLAWVLAF